MNPEEYLLTGDEEYPDVYDGYEFLATQELVARDGALVQTEDGIQSLCVVNR